MMVKLMGTSGAESLAAAANIFAGQTEASLVIKPFVSKMTKLGNHGVNDRVVACNSWWRCSCGSSMALVSMLSHSAWPATGSCQHQRPCSSKIYLFLKLRNLLHKEMLRFTFPKTMANLVMLPQVELERE